MENEQIKTEFNETEREQLIGCLVDELPVLRERCKVEMICAGTYRTAFNYFGDRIIKPYE